MISKKGFFFFLSVMHIFKYPLVLPSAELKCCLLVNCRHSFAAEEMEQTSHRKTIWSLQHTANLNS